MLNQITLADERDQYCLKREGQLFDCKEKTNKTSTDRLDRFYKSYISSVHDYLYHNRPTLYFKSDIALYRDRYRQAENQLSDGKTTIAVEGKTYTSPSFSQIAKEQTSNAYYERIITKLQTPET
mgnify:CR=1 FL=1